MVYHKGKKSSSPWKSSWQWERNSVVFGVFQMQLVFLTVRVHPFPFRTRKLSSFVPTILGGKLPGKIGRCWHSYPSCIYCGTDNLLFIPGVMMISIHFAAVDFFRLILVPGSVSFSVSFDSGLLFMNLFHQDLIFPWFSLLPIDFSCFHLIYPWFTIDLPLTSTCFAFDFHLNYPCFVLDFHLICLWIFPHCFNIASQFISHHNLYIPP